MRHTKSLQKFQLYVPDTEWDKARVYITDAFQINSQAAIDLHPELWMQLCHVITESTHTVYLQGKVATRTVMVIIVMNYLGVMLL